MRHLSFDETKALSLYHQGKNDTQIGQAVGTQGNAIFLWRKKRNLPSLYTKLGTQCKTGVNFREALNPLQAVKMEKFLRALSWAGRKAVEAGVKPDVMRFMDACQKLRL